MAIAKMTSSARTGSLNTAAFWRRDIRQGTKSGRPAGSGWYAVERDAGKYAAKESGIYGCKFDASGNATACGAAALNTQAGELDIATAR